MLYDQIQEAVRFIRSRSGFQPRFGIILGTGLSGLADEIDIETEIAYGEIPHFPESTAPGHRSRLILGHLEGIPVVAMAGRFHYYEGYSMQQVTFPVRVLKFLGIERLVISNASGGLVEDMETGEIVFVRDHINLQPENPLRGHNDERLGPRFPDMLGTYDRALNAIALGIAADRGIRAREGVYLGLQGPNLETPAESLYLRTIGADVVGMSTVPEVLVARHMDLPVFVLSVVANKSLPVSAIVPTTAEDVINAVRAVEPDMRAIVVEVLRRL
ncbi:MAG TPA: purine-nucleoside phosphorylase [Flavilitoribacter sp.]|nr:purine-nucleoside phosphorylase [Flavilitoribacter sp.]HMQ90179.1 purine-nucleoside phosphorylase [Flavilitoribacter sp.]